MFIDLGGKWREAVMEPFDDDFLITLNTTNTQIFIREEDIKATKTYLPHECFSNAGIFDQDYHFGNISSKYGTFEKVWYTPCPLNDKRIWFLVTNRCGWDLYSVWKKDVTVEQRESRLRT